MTFRRNTCVPKDAFHTTDVPPGGVRGAVPLNFIGESVVDVVDPMSIIAVGVVMALENVTPDAITVAHLLHITDHAVQGPDREIVAQNFGSVL